MQYRDMNPKKMAQAGEGKYRATRTGKEEQCLKQFSQLQLGEGQLGKGFDFDSVKLLICWFACLTFFPFVYFSVANINPD